MAGYRPGLSDFIGASAGAFFIAATVALNPLLTGWYRRWGATDAEAGRRRPGDELVPHPRAAATRAITVKAAAARIWPWLLQIGLERGGWYSYDLLEAAAGAADFADGHTARRIIPELQNLAVGDKIWMHQRILPLTVVAMEAPVSLVFLTRVDLETKAGFELGGGMPAQYVNSSWAFYLDETGRDTTRLIVRSRLDYNRSPVNFIAWRIFTDPISFVMERKMLFTLKKSAETTPA